MAPMSEADKHKVLPGNRLGSANRSQRQRRGRFGFADSGPLLSNRSAVFSTAAALLLTSEQAHRSL